MNDPTTSRLDSSGLNCSKEKPYILVLSAYDAESHKRWHTGLVRTFNQYHFEVLTLPARYFNWRVRGNALTWALTHNQVLVSRQWSAIIATSMVDLATLKGLVPELSHVKTLLYFHENQFAYPLNFTHGSTSNCDGTPSNSRHSNSHKPQLKRQSVEPQMVSLYSALAADHVVFNSDYNFHTFINGLKKLLKKLPDHVPAGIPSIILEKTTILPVPLEDSCFELAQRRKLSYQSSQNCGSETLTVIWNHRWEYDKGPEFLLAILERLAALAPHKNMIWHIVGQRFRQVPPAFELIKKILMDQGWLGAWGYLPVEQYQAALVESDIVLSTALHEFQGLAVMDAVAAGCIPVLPNELAYPNFFNQEYLYVHGNAESASDLLLNANLLDAAPYFKKIPSWANLYHEYDSILKQLMPS